MRKLLLALLGLSACYAWPTVENPDYPRDDAGSSSGDGGTTSSGCPAGGVLVSSAAALQSKLASALATNPTSEQVFCLSSTGSYGFSAPVAAAPPTLGSVYLPPITAAVTLIGLGRSPSETVLAPGNANAPPLDFSNLRCPSSSARFFYVKPTGHLKLVNLVLSGGCVQGGRGGQGAGGGGGGGGGAGAGGAILVEGGKLTLDRVGFRSNLALGGVGGSSRTGTSQTAGGGGGGGGLDPSGSVSDGATATDPAPQESPTSGASGGGSTGGAGTTGMGAAGQGSGGGGGGGGMTNMATAKGSSGGPGAPLAGGGGGGAAVSTGAGGRALGGAGGAAGFCGGGGGGGGGSASGTSPSFFVGPGGGVSHAAFLGTQGRSFECGDPGESSQGVAGGAGGSGWGLGGAIAFLGGELSVLQLDPVLQVNNLALSPSRLGTRRDGTGSFLFAIGTESGAIQPFKTTQPPDVPGVVIVNCTNQGGCL
jgi:hypothetical protein